MNLDEHTLADELHACVMDLARVHHVANQLLEVLDAFGSPHVELEPANVIIGPDDHVGLRHGTRAARVPWAAPETLADGTLTYRSNIYSFGVILNAMFAARPELPQIATDLVTACMNKTATARPKSFAAVRAQLGRLGWYAFARGAWHRRFIEKDDRERTLVESMRKAPDDDAMRGVYADWLEENGDPDRATFLRHIEGEARFVSRDQTSWRAIVARTPIVGCRHTECPLRWSGMRTIDGIDNLRRCQRCEKVISYCTSLEQVEVQGLAHTPVALDAMVSYTNAVNAFERGRFPPAMPTYNPPPPPPEVIGPPGNPPRPDYRATVPDERNALARFFGWFRRK